MSVEAGGPRSKPVHKHLGEVEDLVVEDAKQEHLVSVRHPCEPLHHLLFEVLINAFFRKPIHFGTKVFKQLQVRRILGWGMGRRGQVHLV